MKVGIGLECTRSLPVSLSQSIQMMADIGFEYVEPYAFHDATYPINSHLTLKNTSDYHHLGTQASEELIRARHVLDATGVQFSAIDSHSILLAPHVGIPHLKNSIDLAEELGCPIVMSDEGPIGNVWPDLDFAFDVMCHSIEQIVAYARRKNVLFAVEMHNPLTTSPKYVSKLLDRFAPDELGVNFDTGNSFLAGNDPVEMLQAVIDRVVHVHIKDIPESQLHLRGKVTGTRVGVAAGQGMIDLPAFMTVLADHCYEGVMSVECDTVEEASQSLEYLTGLVSAVSLQS